MNKNIIIGGIIVTSAIVAGAIYYFNNGDLFPTTDSVNNIINDYQYLFNYVTDPAFQSSLSSLCNDKALFNKKIAELKESLEHLRARKVEYILQAGKEIQEIEKKREEKMAYRRSMMGAACPRDYNGEIMLPGSWDVNRDGNQIPPAYWPPNLDGGSDPPPGWPLNNEGKPLPPGICARDYDGELMSKGMWEPDLDGNLNPPSYWPRDANYRVIPPPGWPLDADGEPLPPGSLETPASYAPDYLDDDYEPELAIDDESNKPIDASQILEENVMMINDMENFIEAEIIHLSSICDNKKDSPVNNIKKKVSADCSVACSKFSKCDLINGGDKEDQKDDYIICMKECPAWKEETRICVNKIGVINETNCASMALCIGNEIKYNKGFTQENIEKMFNK